MVDKAHVRPAIPVALAVGAIGLVPATGHGPAAVHWTGSAGLGVVRRTATAFGYYDASTQMVVDNHSCGSAGGVSAFGVLWIGGPVPRSWMTGLPGSTPHRGTMHRTSFWHAVFVADDGATVQFTHPNHRFFISAACAIQ